MLITNSEWSYTQAMMSWCFDRGAPGGNWRNLFDLVVVSAAKPRFFAENQPAYRVVDEQRGWLTPHRGPYAMGSVYHGGSARMIETSLGLTGDQILYVGDHLFGDVHMSKATLRWRTALILRELEAELQASAAFAADERRLRALMGAKADIEDRLAVLRMDRVRTKASGSGPTHHDIESETTALRRLDEQIAPLAQAAARLGNARWGPLMRAGNDKSLFARQVERYADLYTSRVSNLGRRTPFAYLRATRTSLPHDAVFDEPDRS
jgi:hypothetical protein